MGTTGKLGFCQGALKPTLLRLPGVVAKYRELAVRSLTGLRELNGTGDAFEHSRCGAPLSSQGSVDLVAHVADARAVRPGFGRNNGCPAKACCKGGGVYLLVDLAWSATSVGAHCKLPSSVECSVEPYFSGQSTLVYRDPIAGRPFDHRGDGAALARSAFGTTHAEDVVLEDCGKSIVFIAEVFVEVSDVSLVIRTARAGISSTTISTDLNVQNSDLALHFLGLAASAIAATVSEALALVVVTAVSVSHTAGLAPASTIGCNTTAGTGAAARSPEVGVAVNDAAHECLVLTLARHVRRGRIVEGVGRGVEVISVTAGG